MHGWEADIRVNVKEMVSIRGIELFWAQVSGYWKVLTNTT